MNNPAELRKTQETRYRMTESEFLALVMQHYGATQRAIGKALGKISDRNAISGSRVGALQKSAMQKLIGYLIGKKGYNLVKKPQVQ